MLSLRGLILLWLFVLSGENCQHQNSHDVDDLDHLVNSRTGGILVGITNRVTGDSRVVSVRSFTTMMAIFDLSIDPGE